MRVKQIFFWAVVMCAVSVFPATEAEAKPAEVATVISADKPLGSARLRKFGFRVYDAQFWSDQAGWRPDEAYALSLVYALSITADDLVDRSLQEMKRQRPLSQGERQRYRQELQTLMPDVKKGDRITAVHKPGRGLYIYHNGQSRGHISDNDFANLFAGIWLSAETSEPEMRRALLALPRSSTKEEGRGYSRQHNN